MKKMLAMVALASLIATGASAQFPDEGPDSFGVFFMVDGNYVNSIMGVDPGFMTVYIVLAGPSAPSIAAWEVALDFDAAGGTIIAPGLTGDAINYATMPEFIVGLGTPLVAEEYNVLAEMNFFLMAPGELPIFGGPVEIATLEGVPAYVNGADLTDVRPGYFSVDADGMFTDDDGWTTIPLATINGAGSVATEDATWSGVKNQYR